MFTQDIDRRVNEKLAGIADELIAKPLFAHATTASNLRKILESGALSPLKRLAENAANSVVDVESGLTSFGGRDALTAGEAAKTMAPYKDVDKLFLTREGYLPTYGDHIIAKNMPSPEKRVALNLMPQEYSTGKDVGLSGADVFVPDEVLPQWQKDYPGMSFKPRSAFTGKEYSRWHGAAELPGKLLQMLKDKVLSPAGHAAEGLARRLGISQKLDGMFANRGPVTTEQILAAHPDDLSRLLGHKATPVGSSALGIALDSSDTDILLPFANEELFNKALADIPNRFPDLRPSTLNEGRPFKVFKGKSGDKHVDLVFARGDPAFAYRDAVNTARRKLTDEQRYEILSEKERLKNAWLFPEMRYRNYKMNLARELGTLTQDIWK